MKKISFALLALITGAAMATSTPDPTKPGQTQTGTVTVNPVTTSNANAGAVAGANAGSESSSASNATGGNATGGNVGDVTAGSGYSTSHGGGGGSANVDASTYSATGDVSNTLNGGNSKYISLGFPAPVWTSVPTAFGCIVTESGALSGGWSFASGSKSKQYSDVVCTTIRMAEAATLHCQFESAAMLNKVAFEKMYEGQKGDFFLADKPRNLKPMECEELKRPALRMAANIAQPATPILQLTTVNSGAPSTPAACVKAPRTYTPAKKKATSICK